MNYAARRLKAVEAIVSAKSDALLVTSLANVRYLTGFTGSAAILVLTPNGATLVTDGRYLTQAADEAPGVDVLPVKGTYDETLATHLEASGFRALLFEEQHLKVAQLRFVESRLSGRSLTGSRGIVERLREVKDQEEITLLRRAASGLTTALSSFRRHIRSGATEKDLAAELDFALRRAGYDKPAFETIVASGARSALPHGRPSEKELQDGDVVVFDFGGMQSGYASDVTRTFVVGSPDETAGRIYEVVAEAQQKAIEAVRPGVKAGDIDRVARDVVSASGHADHFTHGTGHGVGLEVHEEPWIRKDGDRVLEPGMVFTVEPGIYLPGRAGVRLEDDVLVTDTGFEILSREPDLTTGLRGFRWVC